MASSVFAVANAAGKIQTAGQLRAAMGAVANALQDGYDKLGLSGPSTSIPNLVEGVRLEATSLLDTVNKSAQILYNIYPDDPDLQDEEISTAHAISAGKVIAEANDALKTVEDAIGSNFSNVAQFVIDAITASGQIAATTVQTVSKAVVAGAAAFITGAWPTLLLIGFGIVVYFWARARLIRKLVS